MTTPAGWPSWMSTDGNSITMTGVTVTFSNAFDPTTGVATLTITPSGGLSTLPALMDGQSGPPPTLQVGTVTTLAAGSQATATLTQLSPGGPGQASVYQVNFGIPAGAAGASGGIFGNIQGGQGGLFAGALLVWDAIQNLFVPTAPVPATKPAQPVTFFASSINSTSGSSVGPRTLASISIPAQAFAYIPQPTASCVVTGTVNTQVNLQSFIGTATGNQVGVGYGVAGVATQTLSLVPGIPAGSGAGYGKVAANTSATIILCATEVASTTDSWSTAAATTSFQVTAQPVQS